MDIKHGDHTLCFPQLVALVLDVTESEVRNMRQWCNDVLGEPEQDVVGDETLVCPCNYWSRAWDKTKKEFTDRLTALEAKGTNIVVKGPLLDVLARDLASRIDKDLLRQAEQDPMITLGENQDAESKEVQVPEIGLQEKFQE